jgi:hypothetical protein
MNRNKLLALLAVCVVPVVLAGCLDDKVLDLVATGETFVDFPQNETSSSWTKPAVIDVGQEIRNILNDNGYDETDIKDAHVTSVHYGVSSFSQAHDWTISGSIRVTYNGNEQPLMSYVSQSVQAALGKKIPATLHSGGVDLINQALDDFVSGQNPVLTFTINNLGTTPGPSGGDPIIFDWRAWLAIQIILKQEVKIPDPF